MKPLLKLSAVVATSVALTFSAFASDWTGGGTSIPWSSNGNPGWNGTGIPDAVGAVANFSDSTITGNPTTFADIPVTVGTISLNANADVSRGILATNNITLNNGGSGATISNTNPSPTTNNFLTISDGGGTSGGQFVLADNLLVTNTGGSTANSAIVFGSHMTGTGNVAFSTVWNPVTGQHIAPGSINIIQASTFVGNVLVQKGVILTNAGVSFGGAFGDPGNMVTLGQAGQGDVTVMATANNVDMQNPFTVVAGTGGTITIGSTATQGSTFGGTSATAGNIALNGNLTVDSWVTQTANPGAFVLEGTISGPGGLTFTTTTQVNGGDPTKVISELDTFDSYNGTPNTYKGGTIVNAGTLIANGDGALGAGNVSLTAPNVQLTEKNGTNYIADTATLSLFDNTDKLNLNFSGTDKVGVLIINGVALAPGIYNSSNLSEITGTGKIQVLGMPSSLQITSVTNTTDGHFHITGLTNPTLTVTVHASSDLVTYDAGVPVTADTSGIFQYDDATGLPQRFYKATYP